MKHPFTPGVRPACFGIGLLLGLIGFSATLLGQSASPFFPRLENRIVPPPDLDHVTYVRQSLFGSNSNTSSIYLLPDGTYVGLSVWVQLSGRLPYDLPLSSGAYTYTVDSINKTAVLTLNPDEGEPVVETMGFTDPTSGQLDSYDNRFYLKKGPGERPLANTSLRGNIDPAKTLIAGFVVTRAGGYLLRVIGPTLRQFGVDPVVEAATVTFNEPGGKSTTRTSWQDGIPSAASLQKLAQVAGAFPLDPTSSEIVWFARLEPGVYTIEATNAGTTSGDLLIEVYPLP